MQKRFRVRSQRTPDFHHYDIPGAISQHPEFRIEALMREQNHILVKSGIAHCRITFCSQFRNFKIVRPDDISNSHWHEIKNSGSVVMQEYFDWYSTPPPRTTPRELQKTFLTNGFDKFEDGEVAQDAQSRQWNRIVEIPDQKEMLEAYFDAFPKMKTHPMAYAFICGKLVPKIEDLSILLHFKRIYSLKCLNALFNAVLPISYAMDFCRQLFANNVYPLLSDVEGHLTFEIDNLKMRNQVTDLILHDLNIDLLMLAALTKEANYLGLTNPGVDHMMSVLPQSIYHFFKLRDRVAYLCKTEFWKTYHFTRISCHGPNQIEHQNIPRRDVLSFSVCNSCVVYCARKEVIFNWTAQHAVIPTQRAPLPPLRNQQTTSRKRQQSPPEEYASSPPRQKRSRIPFTDEAPKKEATQSIADETQAGEQRDNEAQKSFSHNDLEEELDFGENFI